MRKLTIEGKTIEDSSRCYVIAEIGHNHQGDLETAKEMFKVAKACGADAVKLQKRDNRKLFTEEGYNKPYENPNSYGKTYGEHREFLEFEWHEYSELKEYANEIEFDFYTSGIMSQITLAGFPELEISVEIPEQNLRRFNLTFAEVSQAIAMNNQDISGGQIRSDNEEIMIRSSC